MLEALKAVGRSLFGHETDKRRSRSWLGIVIAVLALGFASVHAHAEGDDDEGGNYYVFQSVITTGNKKWFIDIPASDYSPGKQLTISECTGKANQTFGFDNGSNLTAGGLCMDALGPNSQTPTAGDPVTIVECDGSDHQVWELQTFESDENVFAIANAEGLCVTADGEVLGRGTALILAQCNEQENQGWVSGDVAAVAFAVGGGGRGGGGGGVGGGGGRVGVGGDVGVARRVDYGGL